jgi:hypothetical protein
MADNLPPLRVTEPPEILYVATTRVACDGSSASGGEGALGGGAADQFDGRSAPGHPRVFLEMGEGDRVTCPYCDRLFVHRPAIAAGA